MNFLRLFFRLSLVMAFMLSAFFLSGCMKEKVIIKLNPDGSGKILPYKIFTFEASMLIDQQMKNYGQNAEIKKGMEVDSDIFGDSELLESKILDESGQKGVVAVYAFKDINNVSVPASIVFSDPMNSRSNSKKSRAYEVLKFKFDKDSRILETTYPATQKFPEVLNDLPPPGYGGDKSIESIWGMTGKETTDDYYRKLFKDLSYQVIIEKAGTNEKGIKLVDFDLNKLSEKDLTVIKYFFTLAQQKPQSLVSEGMPFSVIESKYPAIFNRQSNSNVEVK